MYHFGGVDTNHNALSVPHTTLGNAWAHLKAFVARMPAVEVEIRCGPRVVFVWSATDPGHWRRDTARRYPLPR